MSSDSSIKATPEEGDEESFERAADLVTSAVAAGSLSQSQQLALYGLYKQSLCGPCKDFRPSFFDVKARAKWAAWKNLECMPAEEAKIQYVQLVQSLLRVADEDSDQPSGLAVGPQVSTLKDDVSDGEQGAVMGNLHMQASEGNTSNVLRLLESGAEVNMVDSEGCSALHWASDRGSLEVVDILLQSGADPNIRDADGQTPLHYAALCGHEQIVKHLRASGADAWIQDANGHRPEDVAIPSVQKAFNGVV